jgi:hypothetical protein
LHEFIQVTDKCYETIRQELTATTSPIIRQWIDTSQTASQIRKVGLLGLKDIFQGHGPVNIQDILCTMLVQHAALQLLRQKEDIEEGCLSSISAWKEVVFTASELLAIKFVSDKLSDQKQLHNEPSLQPYPELQTFPSLPAYQVKDIQFHENLHCGNSHLSESLDHNHLLGPINYPDNAALLSMHGTLPCTAVDMTSRVALPHPAPFQPPQMNEPLNGSPAVESSSRYPSSFLQYDSHDFVADNQYQYDANLLEAGCLNHWNDNTGPQHIGSAVDRAIEMRQSDFNAFRRFLCCESSSSYRVTSWAN